jgi:hypothetical protein
MSNNNDNDKANDNANDNYNANDNTNTNDNVLVYRPYRPVFPQPRSLAHHNLRIT